MFIRLIWHLLCQWQQSLNFTKVYINKTMILALNDSVHNVFFAINKIRINNASLCFTNTLRNNLFCCLRSYATKIFWSHFNLYDIIHFKTRINKLRFFFRDFQSFIKYLFNNYFSRKNAYTTAITIYIHADILCLPKIPS